jgi:hypothetical protein
MYQAFGKERPVFGGSKFFLVKDMTGVLLILPRKGDDVLANPFRDAVSLSFKEWPALLSIVLVSIIL